MRTVVAALWVVLAISWAFGLYATVSLWDAKASLAGAALVAAPFWIAGTIAMGLAGVLSAIERQRVETVAALLRISSLGQMQLDRTDEAKR